MSPPGTRKASCNADSRLQNLVWRAELNGTFNFNSLAPYQPTDEVGYALQAAYENIDLSGNPNLKGPLIPGSPSIWSSLKTLNLSNSGLSGRLPRLDAWLPNLVSLDASNTFLTGYVPPMPKGLTVCKLPPTVCYFPDASWASTVPTACLEGLSKCDGSSVALRPVPELPAPIRPHWGSLPDPLQNYGLATIQDQCSKLYDWITFHGIAVNKTEFMSATTGTCCNWGNAGMSLYRIYCIRNNSAIGRLEFNFWGLAGDINQPPGTMSTLQALGIIHMKGNNLSGGFPGWVFNMSDLGELLVSSNQLSGTVPNLIGLESLRTLDMTNNSFSGNLPPFRGQSDNYCWIGAQRGNGACFGYDSEWSEPTCSFDGVNTPITACPVQNNPADQVSPQTDWHCYMTACDVAVKIRRVWSFQQGVTLQCQGNRGTAADYGTNQTACAYYHDSSCTQRVNASGADTTMRALAPRAPVEEGPLCLQEQAWTMYSCMCPQCLTNWCPWAWYTWGKDAPNSTAVTTMTATATRTATATPSPGTWTCVQSCPDKGNRVLVRGFPNGTVQCEGPDSARCSWWSDAVCTVLAPGEPAPDPSKNVGYTCEQTKGKRPCGVLEISGIC